MKIKGEMDINRLKINTITLIIVFIIINNCLATDIPLNPDYITGENNNGGNVITKDIELFTKKQNEIKQQDIENKNQLIDNLNNQLFLINEINQNLEINNILKEKNIFMSSKKNTYKPPNPVVENNYDYIIILLVGFIFCVLTYFLTIKYKKRKKDDKDEYNFYFKV